MFCGLLTTPKFTVSACYVSAVLLSHVAPGGSQDLSVQQQILQHCKDSDNADVREEATLSLEAVQPQADDVGRLGQQLAEQQLG